VRFYQGQCGTYFIASVKVCIKRYSLATEEKSKQNLVFSLAQISLSAVNQFSAKQQLTLP
jgi:hypothetical protein